MVPDQEDLYQTHRAALVRYCTALCRGDSAAGEDLAQEAFLRALQAPEFWQLDPAQRRAWLYTAARRLAADRGRRGALAARLYPRLAQREETTDPGFAAVEAAALLGCLPVQDRQLFALRYLAGFTAAELAARLGQPPATVRARLRRLRRRLAKLLQEE